MRSKPKPGLLPFVLLNMSMTADGKIATANREVSSFGSRTDREHLLELRASADAVMAGARTVDLNPVNLGPGPQRFRALRVSRGLAEYNLRIIVSRSGSVDPNSEIFKKQFSPVVILTTESAGVARLKALSKLAELRVCGKLEIDFKAALRWLRKARDVKRLLCEGGGQLNDAMFKNGLVDELHLTICPYVFGGRSSPTIVDGEGFLRLRDAPSLKLVSRRHRLGELFLRFRASTARREGRKRTAADKKNARHR